MVDLSQVKMPIVEYSDGSKEPLEHFYRSSDDGDYCVNGKFFESNGDTYRGGAKITAIHPADQAADGWVRTEHAAMKQFGDCTIAINVSTGAWSYIHHNPKWLGSGEYTTAEIDAAYAAHVAAKPVLVWDEDLKDYKFFSAHKVGDSYHVYHDGTDWIAVFIPYSKFARVLAGGCATDSAAKAACERHAKGE